MIAKEKIMEIIRKHTDAPSGSALDNISLFYGSLSLTSIRFLELIIELEKAVGLRLREEDLTPNVLNTAGTLADHIIKRVSEKENAI